MGSIIFICGLRDKEVISQRPYGKSIEVIDLITLLRQRTGIEKDHSANIHPQPCRSAWISIVIEDVES